MLASLTISDGYRPLVNGLLVPTHDKYETRAMRERFGLKKYQRGILQLATGGTMIAAGGGGTVPSVSNIVITNTVSSGLCNAAIVFHDDRAAVGSNDGRILTKRHNTVYTDMGNDDAGSPVDHTGEWTSDAVTESDWEVACTSEDTGTWDFFFASVGVYTTLDTSDMAWRENRTGGKGYTPGTDQCIATFRIREVADTGNFTSFQVNCSAVQT